MEADPYRWISELSTHFGRQAALEIIEKHIASTASLGRDQQARELLARLMHEEEALRQDIGMSPRSDNQRSNGIPGHDE